MPIGLMKSSERDQMKTDATVFGRKLFIDKSFEKTQNTKDQLSLCTEISINSFYSNQIGSEHTLPKCYFESNFFYLQCIQLPNKSSLK